MGLKLDAKMPMFVRRRQRKMSRVLAHLAEEAAAFPMED